MSYSTYKTASFGSSRAGLTTVGYRLYNADGTPNGGRIAVSIQDLGGGCYGAFVTFPDAFRGRITWDTGGGSPLYVSEEENPQEIDINQNIPVSNLTGKTTQTVADCLSAARAYSAGSMSIIGVTQTVLGPDGTTVRTFTLNDPVNPSSRL